MPVALIQQNNSVGSSSSVNYAGIGDASLGNGGNGDAELQALFASVDKLHSKVSGLHRMRVVPDDSSTDTSSAEVSSTDVTPVIYVGDDASMLQGSIMELIAKILETATDNSEELAKISTDLGVKDFSSTLTQMQNSFNLSKSAASDQETSSIESAWGGFCSDMAQASGSLMGAGMTGGWTGLGLGVATVTGIAGGVSVKSVASGSQNTATLESSSSQNAQTVVGLLSGHYSQDSQKAPSTIQALQSLQQTLAQIYEQVKSATKSQ